MTAVRVFTPENRLRQVLDTLEGATAAGLVRDAEARVAGMRDAVRDYVAGKLEELRPYATMGEADLFANCRTLGRTALDIAEVAAVAGLAPIGDVARGVASMIDSLIEQGVWHTEALRLHLDTLALLTSPMPSSELEPMLARLHSMRAAIGVVD